MKESRRDNVFLPFFRSKVAPLSLTFPQSEVNLAEKI